MLTRNEHRCQDVKRPTAVQKTEKCWHDLLQQGITREGTENTVPGRTK